MIRRTTVSQHDLSSIPPSPENKQTDGNTHLHELILQKTPKQINQYIDNMKTADLAAMVRTVNDKGKLPVDLIHESKFSYDEVGLLYSKLLSTRIINFGLKNLADLIDTKNILNKWNPNSEIYENLQLACTITNEIRKEISASSSHPQTNFFNLERKNKLKNRIYKMRVLNNSSVLSMYITENPIKLIFDSTTTFIENRNKFPLKEKMANCGEMSFIAYQKLKKLSKNKYAEIFQVKNGDHGFLVIGKDKNAVVCDPWAGEAYPFSEITHRLNCYRCFTTADYFVNIVTSYNPKVHIIEPISFRTTNLKIKLLAIFIMALIAEILYLMQLYHQQRSSTSRFRL
jgi:hypothetical protein